MSKNHIKRFLKKGATLTATQVSAQRTKKAVAELRKQIQKIPRSVRYPHW